MHSNTLPRYFSQRDSLQVYLTLSQQHILLGGLLPSSEKMYNLFTTASKASLLFRPLTLTNADILLSGTVEVDQSGEQHLRPTMEHLTCFAGGMFILGGKVFANQEDVDVGRKLTEGCIWAYENTITGLMPETLTAVPCESTMVDACVWDEDRWFKSIDLRPGDEDVRKAVRERDLSPGFAAVTDKRYLLRCVYRILFVLL